MKSAEGRGRTRGAGFVFVMLIAGFGAGSCAAEEKKEPPQKVDPAKDKGKKDPKEMNADEAEEAGLCPVCKNESKPIYHFEYQAKTYRFATRKCQSAFSQEPLKFGVKAGPKEAKKAAKSEGEKTPAKKEEAAEEKKEEGPGMMGQ